jgi:hypothetical protein
MLETFPKFEKKTFPALQATVQNDVEFKISSRYEVRAQAG